jgi:hypothetical protein
MRHLRLVKNSRPLGFQRLDEVHDLVGRLRAHANELEGEASETAIADIRAAAVELLALRAVVLVAMAANIDVGGRNS